MIGRKLEYEVLLVDLKNLEREPLRMRFPLNEDFTIK
jgi:hypothetical protein